MFVLAWAFWRFVDGIIEAFGGTTKRRPQRPAPMKLVRDPVCGTFVAPASALSVGTGAQTRFFCSEKCRSAYQMKFAR